MQYNLYIAPYTPDPYENNVFKCAISIFTKLAYTSQKYT